MIIRDAHLSELPLAGRNAVFIMLFLFASICQPLVASPMSSAVIAGPDCNTLPQQSLSPDAGLPVRTGGLCYRRRSA
jgi:hypothetical protein